MELTAKVYQGCKRKSPEWLQTFAYHSEADSREKEFLVATDEASLLYMASLGCIEMNPWSSTIKNQTTRTGAS